MTKSLPGTLAITRCKSVKFNRKRTIKIELLAIVAIVLSLAAHAEVIKLRGGTVMEGSYVNGVKQGQFVIPYSDGRINKGSYVNDKQEEMYCGRD